MSWPPHKFVSAPLTPRSCLKCGRTEEHPNHVASERRWTGEHGPDQLYNKFIVTRVRTGEPLPTDEFVFVLRPETDQAAVVALRTYANAVRHRSPILADQIERKLAQIEADNLNAL